MSELPDIRRAFYASQDRRPYKLNDEIISATIPPGGDWRTEALPGSITRSIMWGGTEVALVNPRGDLTDTIEGQISMAFRALPLLDATVRSIIVLAEDASNLGLIREMALSVIAYIEVPAPKIPEPEEDDDALHLAAGSTT